MFCVEKTKTLEPYAFDVPHSVTALEDRGWVCVADRENGRVTCFNYDGGVTQQIHPTPTNNRVYAVSYSQPDGNALFIVSKILMNIRGEF